MALKFKAKSKKEIPAELQSFYVERDGGFVLDVEGAVDKTKLDEFRANNYRTDESSRGAPAPFAVHSRIFRGELFVGQCWL